MSDKVDDTDPRLPPMLDEFRDLDGASVLFDAEEGVRYPTLDEVGKVLPIGYADSRGGLHKDFETRTWDYELEELLGEVMEHNPEMPMGQYISEVVCAAVARIGTIDFDKLKRSARRLLIHSMYYADVLWMYIHVRVAAYGKELRLDKFKCEKCKKPIDFVGDLGSLEVKVLKDPPSRVMELEHGLEYAGKRRNSIRLGGLRWAFMETEDGSILMNPAKFKLATLQHAVTWVEGLPEGMPVVIERETLRSMTMKEINGLVAAIDEINGGAVMQISGTHDCGHPFSRPIDWSYGDFFGRSSH